MKLKFVLSVLFLLTISNSFSQENLLTSLTIPENLSKNANAVIRLNKVDVTIESQSKIKTSITRIVTVLNEKGDRNIQAGVGYNNFIKVKSIEAIIFDETGDEIKKIKKRDFIDHSAVDGGTLYSDSRVLFMGYTPIKYPYTVSFTCEMESSNTLAIPTWRPIDNYFLSIENDSYAFIDKANLGLRFKEKNFNGYEVEINNTKASLSYSISNIAALKPEDLSPSISNIAPQVMVAVSKYQYYGVNGEASNWVEFGEWMNKAFLEGRNDVSDETKQKVLSLVEGIEDPIEKSKLIYEFVQENTRYISVQVGIGGNQPIPAMEVDELKYGDCKGLTNYTQSLLNIAGVTSYYTVVEAGKEIVDFDDDFASLEQGNHIILGIPNNNEMVWLDCTSQIHPFGFIGDFTDNRKVLIVKDEGSEILKTTKYSDSINHQFTKANIKLNTDAGIESELNIKTNGIQYDNRFFIERKSKKDVIEYYKEYWGNINGLEVVDYSFTNDKDKIEFTEGVKVFAKNYASASGSHLIFAPNAFNKNSFIPNRYRNRSQPIKIQRGYLDEDEYVYSIPDGYQIEAMPKNVVIKTQFGEYLMEIASEGNIISYKRKLLILSGKFPKSEYNAYRDFRKKISSLDKSKIILKRI